MNEYHLVQCECGGFVEQYDGRTLFDNGEMVAHHLPHELHFNLEMYKPIGD